MKNFRLAVPALLILLAIAARVIPGPRTIDDAYITFRYARNLLAGQGFVYNPGEAVLGTTTPLYTLMMAGLGALSGGPQAPFPYLALGVNALADAATCLFLWSLGRRLGLERAGSAAALAWAAAPFSVTFAMGGLETSVTIALLSGAVWAAIRGDCPTYAGRVKWRVLAALLASLALLTRLDALILLGPLAVERLWSALPRRIAGGRAERIHAAELAAAVLPYGAWAVYATLTFGSPLPHSILAKAAAYHLGAGEGFIRLLQHYTTPFLEQNLLGTPLAVGLGLVLYPFLFMLGARRVLRSEARLLPWALYPWLYLITFALANPLIFRWYLTPPLPAYFFFIFVGLERLLETLLVLGARLGKKKPREPFSDLSIKAGNAKGQRLSPGWVIPMILAVPILFSLTDWRATLDDGGTQPAPEMAFIKLELLYRRAAERIKPELTAQSVLAAGDVGVLGYFTPARILDTVGLNSPISTGYYPLPADQYVINYAVPADLIINQQPDWVVILEVYGRRSLLIDPRFQAEYHLVEKIETDMYGSDGLLIFQRTRLFFFDAQRVTDADPMLAGQVYRLAPARDAHLL